MTILACIAILLALLSLRLYLRNLRLVVRFRSARIRLHSARGQLAAAERFAGQHLIRSVKRRAALVRLARYCRRLRDDLDVADVVGAELAVGLHEQAARYDAAIDALTRRVAELLPARETSASIAAWQNETFGAATTTRERIDRSDEAMRNAMSDARHANLSIPRPNLSRAIRAAEELAELICLLAEDDNATKAPEEVADIDIVLRGIDAAHGVERAAQVDRKMARNRARQWLLTGDGHGQHVEPTCASLDAFFDEELSADQADAFRDHLATCERCQRVLDGRMQEQVATNRSQCDDRIAFLDGALDKSGAAAFRTHLRGCEACRADLVWDAELLARLSTLTGES